MITLFSGILERVHQMENRTKRRKLLKKKNLKGKRKKWNLMMMFLMMILMKKKILLLILGFQIQNELFAKDDYVLKFSFIKHFCFILNNYPVKFALLSPIQLNQGGVGEVLMCNILVFIFYLGRDEILTNFMTTPIL